MTAITDERDSIPNRLRKAANWHRSEAKRARNLFFRHLYLDRAEYLEARARRIEELEAQADALIKGTPE